MAAKMSQDLDRFLVLLKNCYNSIKTSSLHISPLVDQRARDDGETRSLFIEWQVSTMDMLDFLCKVLEDKKETLLNLKRSQQCMFEDFLVKFNSLLKIECDLFNEKFDSMLPLQYFDSKTSTKLFGRFFNVIISCMGEIRPFMFEVCQ